MGSIKLVNAMAEFPAAILYMFYNEPKEIKLQAYS
jgi:hypothetical protein